MSAAIIETVITGLPYSEQIKNLEIHADSIRFTWRGTRYRVSETLMVEEVGDGVLIGSDKAILMSHCLKQAQFSRMVNES